MDETRPESLPAPDEPRLGAASKARLEELVEFAQSYRNWTGREFAAFVGRDVHNVIPKSGIPKADLIVRLARALDWAPSVVFDQVCGETSPSVESPPRGADDYRELNRAAFAAFAEGRFEEMIALGLRMHGAASSPEQRAEACLREYGGWDGLGRYEQAVEALQRGLREVEIPVELRLRLRANLALAYFVLGKWLESDGVASAVVERQRNRSHLDASVDGSLAMALHARGLSRRSRAFREVDERESLVASAVEDLAAAESAWLRHAERASITTYLAGAHVCRGAAMTAAVVTGEAGLADTIDRVLAEIDGDGPGDSRSGRAWMEAQGWWCVFGAEIVLDAAPGAIEVAQRDQLLAVLTNKGYEFADGANNWALRERMLTVDYVRRTGARGTHTMPDEAVLDRDDVRLLAGAMARFPAFRPLGWELLRQAPRID